MVKLSKPSESVPVTILRPAGTLPVLLLQSTKEVRNEANRCLEDFASDSLDRAVCVGLPVKLHLTGFATSQVLVSLADSKPSLFGARLVIAESRGIGRSPSGGALQPTAAA
jgi:hypothetical protein